MASGQLFRFGAKVERPTNLDDIAALISWRQAGQLLVYPGPGTARAWKLLPIRAQSESANNSPKPGFFSKLLAFPLATG
jgi:hypothetical protein